MEEMRICTHCGEELADDEGTTVGDLNIYDRESSTCNFNLRLRKGGDD